MITWREPKRAGLTWPLPDGWDEERVEAALFGAEPVRTGNRNARCRTSRRFTSSGRNTGT